MSKYAFCDLDYTLLDDKKDISQDNIKTIKEFEQKGNHFIICTGRVPYAMSKYRDILGSKDILCANGGIIVIDNKEVSYSCLDKKIVETVVRYAIKNNIYARIFASDRLYILNAPEEENSSVALFDGYRSLTKDNALETIKEITVIKIIFVSYNPNVLADAFNYIKNANIDTELMYSASFCLEINRKGQNKGKGILDYCKLKGIDIKDTLSIGDNDNDISMFLTTKYSACPSNAIDKVKDIVNYISPCDYKNNAVSDILKNINYEE